jgi:hypothetical protein
MMPARRAVAMTSPLGVPAVDDERQCLGFHNHLAGGDAVRAVLALSLTSTMWAAPFSSR